MPGKKGNKRALIASENRLKASLTCFGKLMLHRALSCWLQLPDGITLEPQSHFIALQVLLMSSAASPKIYISALHSCARRLRISDKGCGRTILIVAAGTFSYRSAKAMVK